MQELNENGYLPPGVHEYSYEDYYAQFVSEHITSKQRRMVHKLSIQWFGKLNKIASPLLLWLDGSFISNKMYPGDLDIVIFFDPRTLKRHEVKLGELQSCCKQFKCDVYYAIIVTKGSKQQEKIHREYWKDQFCSDRQGKEKGIIEIKWDEFIKGLEG